MLVGDLSHACESPLTSGKGPIAIVSRELEHLLGTLASVLSEENIENMGKAKQNPNCIIQR